MKKRQLIRLSTNENCYGCSPKVATALKKDIKNVHQYPGIPFFLEEKLAEKFGVDHRNVVVGAGSSRLIDGIIQTFVKGDDEIIIFERSYRAYEQLCAAHNTKYFLARQTDFTCDVENIFPLISPNTKLIFLANPNNPTGTIISHAQLEKLMRNVSDKIMVVIDEAYCEYVNDPSFPDSFALQKKYPNLVILRTFSKIYGLAGLRIGYAIADINTAEALKKNRIPFFFNCLSEDAALTALEDKKFLADCAKKNANEREFLYKNLKKIGYNVIPSQGNFIYLVFNDEGEKEATFKKLSDEGIVICNLVVFGQDKSLRITVGDHNTCKRIIKLLS
jgi:histidinol-phosphate aminotransferase